jgi:acyl-CoA thioester hydrolase
MLSPMAESLFIHTHRVTYAECTLGNHIYYARYLDLLEAARGEFFRHLGATFLQLHEQDSVFPVIEARLRYKAVACYDDLLSIELWLTQLERVRLEFGYRIANAEKKLLVEANTLHACTSASGKLKRIPDELSARLQPYLRAAQAANPL